MNIRIASPWIRISKTAKNVFYWIHFMSTKRWLREKMSVWSLALIREALGTSKGSYWAALPSKSVMSGQIFLRRSVSDGQDTLVLLSWASPVQALASRKSPLRTAILFPNCMSFSGPSESVHSFKLTIPRCTRKAVWINSVISARFLWLWDRNPPTKNNNKSKNHSFVVSSF